MSYRLLDLPGTGISSVRTLDEFLQNTQTGFHALYADPVLVDSQHLNSVLTNRDVSNKIDAYEYSQNETISVMADGSLYWMGRQLPMGFYPTMSRFYRALRESSAIGSFEENKSLAICQASLYDIANNPAQSANIINQLGYHEYLLWDDAGLWSQAEWDRNVKDLAKSLGSPLDAEKRLAWTGSGKFGQQLAHLCEPHPKSWSWLPKMNELFTAAIKRLERFDEALVEHYKETESSKPPTYKTSDYVRLLCDFLPDHRSRLKSNLLLTSNSMGDEGGPRKWQGMEDWWLHMRLKHLLLDGLLTLWQDSQGQLWLQPASLALLYWAANTAGMPWSQTPEEFGNHYYWNDKHWFGGHRRVWQPHWSGYERA